MHRRPLGRGRTLAALGRRPDRRRLRPAVVEGRRRRPGIPAVGGNGFEGGGIIVFLVGIATLALVALPYAAGDRPLGIDRWLSYLLLTSSAGSASRSGSSGSCSTARSSSPSRPRSSPTARAVARRASGSIVLSRATYDMAREPAYR